MNENRPLGAGGDDEDGGGGQPSASIIRAAASDWKCDCTVQLAINWLDSVVDECLTSADPPVRVLPAIISHYLAAVRRESGWAAS